MGIITHNFNSLCNCLDTGYLVLVRHDHLEVSGHRPPRRGSHLSGHWLICLGMKYADWQTKEQVAARLGVSLKTVERLAAAKKMQRRQRGRPGGSPVAVYNPEDIERLASERAAAEGEPFLLQPAEDGAAAEGAPRTALARRHTAPPTVLAELLKGIGQTEALEHRDALTLDEAARLKGYGIGVLQRLIKEGKLQRYKLRGNAYVIFREDLDRVKDLLRSTT